MLSFEAFEPYNAKLRLPSYIVNDTILGFSDSILGLDDSILEFND